MLRCDSSQWPLLFRIPPHSVGSFSRAESIRSWCWSSASACFALISPFILWYAGMQIFEMTIFDDFSLFYVLSLKIIRSGSHHHHHLFGFFFFPQGVPGTTASVHRPAAGSSCGSSQLNHFQRPIVSMRPRGWSCEACTLFFFFIILISGASLFFLSVITWKWNGAVSPPPVTWFNCRASCRACPFQSRTISCLWWYIYIYMY